MPGSRASQVQTAQRVSRGLALLPFAPVPARVRVSAHLASACLAAAILTLLPLPALAQGKQPQPDLLGTARKLYNDKQYEKAITAAETAAKMPALADRARLVIGRSYLERFRQSAIAGDLEAARTALRDVQAESLPPPERLELLIGLGEALYLDNSFGPAADLFLSALEPGSSPDVRDSVLDWRATSLDRLAQLRPPDDREGIYTEILARMQDELEQRSASASASYWVVVASRGIGDLEAAWHAAIAGWLRALILPRRGAALREDLDHLVQTALIPERARDMGPDRDRALAMLKDEWDAVKANWK